MTITENNGQKISSFETGLLALSLVPLYRMASHIITHTGNSLGTDYAQVIPAVVNLLQCKDLSGLVQLSMSGSHCFIQQYLIHALIALCTGWDSTVELIVALLLCCLRLPLTLKSFSAPGDTSHRLNLAFILALTFGTSQTSTFICGQASISTAVVLFWLVLGIFALTRDRVNQILYLLSAFASGLCGLYITAPIVICGILRAVLLKNKKMYAVSAAAFVLGLLPRLIFHGKDEMDALTFRPLEFLDILGRPFYASLGTDTGGSHTSMIWGATGLTLTLTLLALHRLDKTKVETLLGPLCYIISSMLICALISLARPSIAPWYATFSLFFWMGLVGLATALREKIKGYVALAVILCGYLSSNVAFKDKDFYHATHGMVSESILRHYDIAPTYGENYISAGAKGSRTFIRDIAIPLQTHNWGAFGHVQYWSLQGDAILPVVRWQGAHDWVRDGRVRDFTTDERLDLRLDKGSAVEWNLLLPQNTARVYLNLKKCAGDARVDIYVAEQLIRNLDASEKSQQVEIFRRPQDERLRLVYRAGERGATLEAPTVMINRHGRQTARKSVPCNTASSPWWTDRQDYSSLDMDSTAWKKDGVTYSDGRLELLRPFGLLRYGRPLDIPLNEISDIAVTAGTDERKSEHLLVYQLTTGSGRVINAYLPLIHRASETYSLDPAVLGLRRDDRITGISILPYYGQSDGTLHISHVAFRR